jgi:hypothetical protein
MELLGEPRWRLEWIDPADGWVFRDGDTAGFGDLEIPAGLTSPLLAWPCWPQLDIPPGYLRPAGALFPFDAAGDRISLSWSGGIDAFFFRELAAAQSAERQPATFDWPRFRELLTGDAISGDIRRDPWLADWTLIAAATARSGFDRRRIIPRDQDSLRVTIPCPGPWIAASPFAEPAFWEAGELVDLRVTDTVDTYIAAGAVLRCTRQGWTWFPRR